MMQKDSQPVKNFQRAMENVSLGEVLHTPAALQSFQRFLRRGTSQQRQQLLRSSLNDEADDPDSGLPSPEASPIENSHNKSLPSRAPKLSQKRRLSPQQRTSRETSARKRIALTPPESTTESPSATTAPHLCSRAITYPSSEHEKEAENNEENSANEEQSLYRSIPRSVKQPRDGSYRQSSSHAIPILLVRARQFFEMQLDSRKHRAQYLVRAVQGFLEAPPLPPDFTKDMWSEKSAIFAKPQVAGCTARFQSLYEGHRKIKRGGEQYLSATRFCYIFLEHDLEQIIASQELSLSQGRGKVTAAFHLQAESISITIDTLRAERKAGRGYIRLLMEGGPGFVLRMGSNVSTIWERKLSVSDIALIITFIQTYATDLYKEIKSYDQAAIEALLEGFVAYGWTRKEINETQSSLFDELRRYVNLEDHYLNTTHEDGIKVSSFPTPGSESSQCTSDQEDLLVPANLNLDFSEEKCAQVDLISTNSLAVIETAAADQELGFTEFTDLEIDQILSEVDYDNAFNTMQCCYSETEDESSLFLQDLFPELVSNEDWIS